MTTTHKRRQTVILIGVFFIALIVRLIFLGRENLWFDEAYTWYAAKMPVSKIWFELWHSARYPPLYYVMMHYVLFLGQSEFVLRLPSAIFGAMAVPLLVVWGKRITSTSATWLAAGFLAFSPLTLWYSQEARMYIVVMFFALWAGYSFSGIVRRAGWIYWVGYIVAAILGMYIHYIMFVLLALLNIVAVAWWLAKPSKTPKFPILRWLLAQIILLVLYIPWLPKLPHHWQLTRNETTYPLWILTGPAALAIFAVGGVISLGVLVWLIKNFDRLQKHTKLTVALAVGLLVLYTGLNALAVANRAATLTRQTLIFVPYLYLLFAVSLTALPHWRRWALGILTLTVIAAILSGYLIQKPRWRDASRLIATESVPGDVLVITSPWFSILLDYYSPGDIPVATIRPSTAADDIPKLESEYQHVWLLLNEKEERWVDPHKIVRASFSRTYNMEHKYQLGLLDLLYFNLQLHQ